MYAEDPSKACGKIEMQLSVYGTIGCITRAGAAIPLSFIHGFKRICKPYYLGIAGSALDRRLRGPGSNPGGSSFCNIYVHNSGCDELHCNFSLLN